MVLNVTSYENIVSVGTQRFLFLSLEKIEICSNREEQITLEGWAI
jgi:hypothetical protein